MFSPILTTVIIAHLLISFIYALFITLRHSSLPSAFIPIIFFIPVFGFLAAIAADLTILLKDRMSEPGEIETVKLEEDIY